jgi:dephospho-CoA kinase
MLGLTGDIACGKSTVAQTLRRYGAAVLDADLLVRGLYNDVEFARRVASLFDQPILTEAGTVDRARLGAVVFADPSALQRLESLVHPAVASLRDERIAAMLTSEPPSAIVLEAVKLIESGQARRCDAVWWVTCSAEVQLERLMRTRGLSESAARARLANQPPGAAKRALLGSIPLVRVENNGSLAALERLVQQLWNEFLKSGTERNLSQS